MSLQRISSPKKLRRLSVLVGRPVIRAYAKWFKDQRVLLAFVDDVTAWVVAPNEPPELFTDESVRLVENGIATGDGR
jgi:hypothetical protein